jgi:colicin import membrane protein
MKLAAWIVIACGALLGTSADAATREELKRERQAIEAEYARRAEACRGQFVVTPCLDKVRAGKQQALSGVSQQEQALDALDRQARAEARNRRVAEKAAAAASAPASAPERPQAQPSAEPKAHKPRQKASAPQQDRRAKEEENRAAYEARQREIAAHRLEVQKRNAERAREKPAPRPLPLPASGGT